MFTFKKASDLFTFPLLAFSSLCAGQTPTTDSSSASRLTETLYTAPLIVKTVSWTKDKRDSLSSSWLTTARSIDTWMSGEESAGRNKSRINIGIKLEAQKSGNHQNKMYLRAKLDIPNTKRRLKLFIDSETNDQSSLEDKRLNNKAQSYSTAGISRVHSTHNISISNNVGAKFRTPLDPFYRFKARYQTELTPTWALGAEQRLWYYHSRGWGESSELYFSKELSATQTVRISSEIQYQKRYQKFEFGQFITLYQKIPENHWNSITLGITGSSKPQTQTESWFLAASYKKLIHEDWLVFSVNPKLRFPKDDNWKPSPELELRLDIYFQESD